MIEESYIFHVKKINYGWILAKEIMRRRKVEMSEGVGGKRKDKILLSDGLEIIMGIVSSN